MTERNVRIDATPKANGDASTSQASDELARQVERGQLFTCTALGQGARHLTETRALLHGLADALLERGLLEETQLMRTVEAARAELTRRGETEGPGTVIRVDKEGVPPASATVDCEARMAVCKAVCCRLDFALSVPELESGHLQWDLGRPYFIRHRADGQCVHNTSCGGCGVYANRPKVCRSYSCANDSRIWKNFEEVQLNNEWIDAHLGPSPRARVEAVYMQPPVYANATDRDIGGRSDG
jgi:Fe-S-cluster containining protein